MAQYCAVAPVQMLEVMAEYKSMPPNQLLLAHDIVKSDRQGKYRRLFDGSYFMKKHSGRYEVYPPHRSLVILDNSVVELGKPVEFDMIKEAADTVNPDCVVLPDVYLDTDATIDSCKKAINEWYEGLKPGYGSSYSIPLMYLPQGKTQADFLRAAEAFMNDSRITWWGVPRNIVEYHGSRRWAIRVLHALNPSRHIHMFGFSEDLVDDVVCAQCPWVRSIDSAVPMRCDYHGLEFTPSVKLPPRGDWWEQGTYSFQTVTNYKTAVHAFAGRGWRP
jgi:hypothetical protein